MATTKNTKGKGKDKTPPDPNALRVEVQPDDNRPKSWPHWQPTAHSLPSRCKPMQAVAKSWE
jgi:hypothetical protein